MHVQTTGRLDGFRQTKLLSDMTDSPPEPPPRPYRRPLSQLFQGKQVEQLTLSSQSQLMARRRAAKASATTAQPEVGHPDFNLQNRETPAAGKR